MSQKNAFIANQKFFSLAESFTNFTQSHFLRTKTAFAHAFLRCPQKIPIFTNQKVFFFRKLYELSSKAAFFTYKKPFIRTNLSLLLSKATLFHPPLPIPTPLNLLSTKEYSCSFNLCSNSLRCKAGASHRFKSLPAIPGEVAAFRKTGYLIIAGCFNNNHTSTGDLNRPRSPEVRKPLVYFWFFSYTRKE